MVVTFVFGSVTLTFNTHSSQKNIFVKLLYHIFMNISILKNSPRSIMERGRKVLDIVLREDLTGSLAEERQNRQSSEEQADRIKDCKNCACEPHGVIEDLCYH